MICSSSSIVNGFFGFTISLHIAISPLAGSLLQQSIIITLNPKNSSTYLCKEKVLSA